MCKEGYVERCVWRRGVQRSEECVECIEGVWRGVCGEKCMERCV